MRIGRVGTPVGRAARLGRAAAAPAGLLPGHAGARTHLSGLKAHQAAVLPRHDLPRIRGVANEVGVEHGGTLGGCKRGQG